MPRLRQCNFGEKLGYFLFHLTSGHTVHAWLIFYLHPSPSDLSVNFKFSSEQNWLREARRRFRHDRIPLLIFTSRSKASRYLPR